MGSSKKQTIGYWYKMGLHFGLCHGPVDALTEIRGGDRIAWKGNQTTSGRIAINAPKLFGGEKQEGGIVGALDVMMGEASQQPNDYLAAKLGPKQSAFRGLMTLVFRGGKVGAMNPYPKPWHFRVNRALEGWDANGPWYPEKAFIPLAGGQVRAMNPAHILYATVTDIDRGQSTPRGSMYEPSWRAAADKLYDEGFGLCYGYDGLDQEQLKQFQQQILDIIGGMLQQSRSDGLYYLDLIRDDYDFDALPILGPDDILECEKEASVPIESINQIVVEWFDPITRTNQTTAPIRKLGLVESMGGVISQTRTLRQIPTEELALRAGRRDLQALATPLAKFKLKINRRSYPWIRRGKPFRLQYPIEGIEDMVCLVGDLDLGQLTDAKIGLSAIEDVNRFPSTVYVVPQPSEYVPTPQTPIAAPFRKVFEAPYVEIAGTVATAALSGIPAESGFLAVVGTEPSGLALNYVLASAAQGESFRESNIGDWCPTALASAADTLTVVDFNLSAGARLDQVELGTAALWGSEIVRVDAINPDTGAVRLARGCADTAPTLHVAGERIWFYDAYAASDEREYVDGETVNVKLLTRTPSDQLAMEAAPIDSVVMTKRFARPYLPANLRINGITQPEVDVTAPVTLTWMHRDRVGQADQLVDQTASSIGPEAGTTYTVRAYRGSTLLATTSAITGTTHTLALPPGAYSVRVTVESVRGGLTSLQFQERTFPYAGGLLETELGARLETEEGDLLTIE